MTSCTCEHNVFNELLNQSQDINLSYKHSDLFTVRVTVKQLLLTSPFVLQCFRSDYWHSLHPVHSIVNVLMIENKIPCANGIII